MSIDERGLYEALAAKDPRFDGVFYVGVTTTGIYCRPVCTARTPGRDRCRFFPSAAAAERGGFRPCLRCRPELAPGNAPVDATGRIARAAAARIEAGALGGDESSLETLAGDLGLSSRHVRRAVREELGVSPVELAQTHRLLLAKRLLTETRLPVIDVALASGFGSVRRLNALFRTRYGLTPTTLRRSGPLAGRAEPTVRLSLSFRQPLAWRELVGFLGARTIAGVESVSGASYSRTVAVGPHRGWLRVAPTEDGASLWVELSASLVPALQAALAGLRALLDLDARPDVVDVCLSADPILAPLVAACPGRRLPGAFDGFELLLRAILGQQISVRAASALAGRFAEAFGEPIETPDPALSRLPPTPECLASASPADIAGLGVPATRARCIHAVASAVAGGTVDLGPTPSPEATIARLTALPGIGRWTAEYVAMRALRWPDAFPADDLGVRKALGNVTARQALTVAESWRPWRAYAVMHLWASLERPREEEKSDA